jgi:squalene cyclase
VAGSSNGADCRAAIQQGVRWLCGAQEDGCWRGFPTLAGESNVWVTAFVAAHLREIAPRRTALRAARAYLAAQRWPGSGWSYGGDVPPDADSTAWCLLTLEGTALLSRAVASEAREFLASHQTAPGTSTYGETGGIRGYIGAGTGVSTEGWTSPHPDVTAAALLAGVPRAGGAPWLAAMKRLIAAQSGAGFWEAYWWRGPFYTTALVLRAVGKAGHRLPLERAHRALAALEREQLGDGGFGLGASVVSDPFTTALALESFTRLAYLGGAEGRRAATRALLRQQLADGSWPGDYVMRIPAPDVLDPRHVASWSLGSGGGNSYVPDSLGVFASTLACYALAQSQAVSAGAAKQPGLALPEEPVPDPDRAMVRR